VSTRFDPIQLGGISVQYVRVFFSKANVETPIPHDLGVGVIAATVAKVDKFCRIKDGQMPPAPNAVQLVSDTDAVTATIRVEAVNLSEN